MLVSAARTYYYLVLLEENQELNICAVRLASRVPSNGSLHLF
jgi:hypothetical protein